MVKDMLIALLEPWLLVLMFDAGDQTQGLLCEEVWLDHQATA